MPLDPRLTEILACPRCKTPLELRPDFTSNDSEELLHCPNCDLSYRIEDNVPVLLDRGAKEKEAE